MTVTVRPATPADADAAATLLHTRMSRKVPPERWRRLFDYPWRPADAPDCGQVLDAGGEIAGFLGATYVRRTIGDRTVDVCNLTSWYLLPEHRGAGHGTRMIRAATADPRFVYTNVTATAQASHLFRKWCGLRVWDDTRYVLRRRGTPSLAMRPATAADPLPAGGHAIRATHQGRYARHLWMDDHCHLVLQVARKSDVLWHDVLHASDLAWLGANLQAVADAVIEEDGVLSLDSRLMRGPVDGLEAQAMPQPRLVKGDAPPGLDNLYTEIELLELKLP